MPMHAISGSASPVPNTAPSAQTHGKPNCRSRQASPQYGDHLATGPALSDGMAKRPAAENLDSPKLRKAPRRAESMNLLALPPEIILRIAECSEDVEDFRALQQTSRQLDRVLRCNFMSEHTQSLQDYLGGVRRPIQMLEALQNDRIQSTLQHIVALELTLEVDTTHWCLPAVLEALGAHSPKLESLDLALQRPASNFFAPPVPPIDLSAMRSLTALRQLAVSGPADVDSLLLGLQGHANLRRLSLQATVLPEHTAALLRGLALKELHLERYFPTSALHDVPSHLVPRAALKHIAAVKGLESLNLEFCDAEGIGTLLAQLTNLRTLRLPQTPLGAPTFLSEMRHLASLEAYSIAKPAALSSRRDTLKSLAVNWDAGDELAAVVGELSYLEDLSLGGYNEFNYGRVDEDVDMPEDQVVLSAAGVEHINNLSCLRRLLLKNHALPVGTLARLVQSTPSLTVADFSGNDVDARDIAALSSTPVSSLHLRFCNLQQAALDKLGDLQALQRLDISKNGLLDCTLAFAASLDNLEVLTANDCQLQTWPAQMLARNTSLQVLSLCYNDFQRVSSACEQSVGVEEAASLFIDLDHSSGMGVVFPALTSLPRPFKISVCATDVDEEIFDALIADPPANIQYLSADREHEACSDALLSIPSLMEVNI